MTSPINSVSDARLAEIVTDADNFYRPEIKSMAAELAARRAANTPADGVERFDMAAHLQRQRDWSGKTFGPVSRTAGVVDHIRKELREIEADPSDITEWIDVVILALDGAWRAGYQPQEIIDAMVAKQTRNEGRNWPDWRTMSPDKAIEHDRSGEEPYPALPSQVVGVSIKTLPWKENGAISIWTGELQFGVYYTIYDEGTGWRVFRHQFLSEASETEIAFVSSLAAAKAAAQVNFDQAIQSCLTSPAAEPVAWMTEATDGLPLEKRGTTADPQTAEYWRSTSRVIPLYTHPSASREVTDEMVERFLQSWFGAVWPDAVPDPKGTWEDAERALLAALPEREAE